MNNEGKEFYNKIMDLLRNGEVEEIVLIGKPAVPALIDALKDKDWSMRMEAAETHFSRGRIMTLTIVADVQEKAAEALGKIAKANPGSTEISKIVSALIDALKNEELMSVQWVAAEALGEIAEANPGSTEISKIVPALIDALKDKSWKVREGAAGALGKIGVNDEQFETIIKMLKNEKSLEERDGAARALGCLKDIRAIPALIDALKDEDWSVRWKAAEALGKIVENFVNKKLEEKDYKAALSMIENTTNLILKMYKAEFRKKGKDWNLVKERRKLIEKFNSLTILVKEKVELSNPLNEKEPMEWKLLKEEIPIKKMQKFAKPWVR